MDRTTAYTWLLDTVEPDTAPAVSQATIDAALEPEPIMAALRTAGFGDVRCPVTFGIFREYLARKPEAGAV